MKRLFYCFIVLFIAACTPKEIINGGSGGNMMFNEMNGMYTIYQFDSMCVADTLPSDIRDWQTVSLKDYESNNKIVWFVYAKFLSDKDVLYRVERVGSDYRIIKRVVK